MDYDIDLQYHLSKIIMVPNTLHKKPVTMFLIEQWELLDEIR